MDIQRLFDIPRLQLKRYPQAVALAAKRGDGWDSISSKDLVDRIDRVSLGLLQAGIEAGDRLAILSSNRPEWNLVDLGAQQIGAITVPVYPRVSRDTYRFILQQVQARLLFVEDEHLLEKAGPVVEEADSLEAVYSFEPAAGARDWQEVPRSGEETDRQRLAARRDAVEPEDLATIIYTSGTTGKPKGVMLSHHNIASNVAACRPLLPIREGQRALSFLPLNHVFERMIVYLYLAAGVSVYYAESVDAISENLQEVRPHAFTTVPRLLEKVYERIVSEGRKLPLHRRGIFFWALGLTRNFRLHGRSRLYDLQRKLADRLVFQKWREALGETVEAIISGGAALNPRLARIFTAAGIPVLEGYGLTETSPVLAVNRLEPDGRKFGTVGRPIEGVEIEIADDGEILCRGPNVTRGYYENPEATEEALDPEGWFHTGDIGELDADGFLRVTDRKKSVFKTSGGEYVAPGPIQNRLKESFLIEHALVIGEDRKMVTALIAPDFENLRTWCREHAVEYEQSAGPEGMVAQDAVRARYEELIEEKNESLDHTEQIKKFRLIPDEWSAEGGELTPTMKVRRELVLSRYEGLVEEMYIAE